jgi:cysteine desulfuration protein SufE
MSIEEAEKGLIEDFAVFEDWMGKYEYIIDLGKDVPMIDEKYKDENHTIKGCQSKVWLHSEMKDGRIYFTADSDAIITKGLVAMVISVLSGHTPEEIMQSKLEFIDKIGLQEHLSPTRANGLLAMVKQMKLDAAAHNAITGRN